MAIINISVDTETKEILVNIDGEKFEQVTDVSIISYQDYDGDMDMSVNIGSRIKQENGLRKSTTIYANQNDFQKTEAHVKNLFSGRKNG